MVVEAEATGPAGVEGDFVPGLVADTLDDVDLAVRVLIEVEGPAWNVMSILGSHAWGVGIE